MPYGCYERSNNDKGKVYQFFAECLMALAADAFADVNAANGQLIGF